MVNKEISLILEELDQHVFGKQHQVRLSLACLLAQGHLLIEDLPGMGKTTLAHALAGVLGLEFNRVQFTADLLPADIIGGSIYEADTHSFRFHPGPVFTQILLADEINRASPKAQSALLEAMEERQVSADGETHRLPEPFFVLATQNPTQLVGTFPLPESQLDRFLMRIELGYPDHQSERAILKRGQQRPLDREFSTGLGADRLYTLQRQVEQVHCSDAILDYVQLILDSSRQGNEFIQGLSPRAGIGLISAARAWALIHGRSLVLPEDVQAVAPGILIHRLQPTNDTQNLSREQLIGRFIQRIPVP
ncbi:MAG: MoxR family ATPase [Proteobacteria bacterium]|nr:MoxR family ATPase [Pseudomonadota bacterium]